MLPSFFLNQFILNPMQEGTVKFFNVTKGFGFISPSNGGQDIFVHVSGLIDEIRENDKVSFEVQNGKKGLNAANVRVI
jgi:CspA family cold shock protein